MLLCNLIDLFHRYNVQHRKPRTAEFYQGQLAKIAVKYGTMPAVEFRPVHMLDFKATWHLCLAVQRLYRWAHEEMDLISFNPMSKLQRPPLGSRKRVLDPSEAARLLRACRPDFRRFLLAAREAAARPQELRELEWTDIRWEGDRRQLNAALRSGQACFELADYKGRDRRKDPEEPRIIPISPRLGRLLLRLPRPGGLNGIIFLTSYGLPWNRNSLRLRMRRLRQRIDVVPRKRGEKIVCYTLRHTAATSLAADGMQTSVLQWLLGHANIKTTQRYLHFRKRQLIEAWRRYWQKKADDNARRRGPGATDV